MAAAATEFEDGFNAVIEEEDEFSPSVGHNQTIFKRKKFEEKK